MKQEMKRRYKYHHERAKYLCLLLRIDCLKFSKFKSRSSSKIFCTRLKIVKAKGLPWTRRSGGLEILEGY